MYFQYCNLPGTIHKAVNCNQISSSGQEFMLRRLMFFCFLAVFGFTVSAASAAQNAPSRQPVASPSAHTIDVGRSTLTVRVYKAGMFSGFGHDHEIRAPITEGTVDESSANPTVKLRVNARDLKVIDHELEPKKRSEVQDTMMSDKVLDVDHYPEISFTSTRVTSTGTDHWLVNGMLTLHGETHGVTLKVEKVDGKYTGSVAIKQKDYGIIPVSVAGGTIKVRDEVSIEFAIVTK